MIVRCPACGSAHDLPARLAGMKTRCMSCEEVFEVPEGPSAGREGVPASRGQIRDRGYQRPAPEPEPEPAGRRRPRMTVREYGRGDDGVSIRIDSASLASLLPKSTVGLVGVALVLFLLPWLEVSCGGATLLTQSGVQIVLGDASPGKTFESQMKQREMKTDSDIADILLVLYPAGLLVGGGIAVGWILGREGNRWLPAIAIGAALLVLLGHLGTGFRLERKLKSELGSQARMGASGLPQGQESPFPGAGEQLGGLVEDMQVVGYRWPLPTSVVVVVLAFVSAILAGRVQERRALSSRFTYGAADEWGDGPEPDRGHRG